jgi:hypothetical protein
MYIIISCTLCGQQQAQQQAQQQHEQAQQGARGMGMVGGMTGQMLGHATPATGIIVIVIVIKKDMSDMSGENAPHVLLMCC